jgi:IclR family transcriptional regulator, acetate operon repressor
MEDVNETQGVRVAVASDDGGNHGAPAATAEAGAVAQAPARKKPRSGRGGASNGTAGPGGVQSIERAFDLLEMLADAGGALGLSDLATESGLPLPTVHRLMRTLVNRGYVRQEASRRYTLGSRLIRLGEISSHMLGTWLRPLLAQLVRLTGETANLAMLDGDEVVYIAQVPSPHQMRMFTEPGRRVRTHSTAVGKALLAQLPPAEARALLERGGMPAATPTTITDPDLLLAHLEVIRKQGYAVDEGEQEVGVRCFAVAVPNVPAALAISTSGPQARMTDEAAARIVPALTRIAQEMSETIAAEGAG